MSITAVGRRRFPIHTYVPSYVSLQDTTSPINPSPPEDSWEDGKAEEERSSLKKVLSVTKDIASGLRPVLEVTKEVSDALPPLKGVLSGILAVWKVYDVGTDNHLRHELRF